MANKQPYRIKTISEFHRIKHLPKPEHPLISVVEYGSIRPLPEHDLMTWILDFYSISLKRDSSAKIKYGQQEYDFDAGIMFFISPGQVFSVEVEQNLPSNHSGWTLLLHPEFLWNTPLAKTIKRYEYFGYSINEALFLS